MESFTVGQRWISESEPELGLGTLLQTGGGRVQILFPASGELRQYAIGNAPLKRVRFQTGDSIKTHDDEKVAVRSVREINGLITYVGETREVPESQLSDAISFHRPQDRLLAGQVDDPAQFELRSRTLHLQNLSRRSEVRGFSGGRIDLIPHQLFIAHEVSGRQAPRVLLSDEVGLGKTIEACLIIHRLLLTGRASRILVLVPETLVHQWFLEMYRRFNVWLKIFDEERCSAIEIGQPDCNPFLDEQILLCSIQFLAGSEKRSGQAMAAEWDLLVVDEAHHLEWNEQQASPEYRCVEALSQKTDGLLLLTATPEQLGLESHFARLRLLDPDRYSDFERFRGEAQKYQEAARLAGKLESNETLGREDMIALQNFFSQGGEGTDSGQIDFSDREKLLSRVLDLHGPGRVMFRNTRSVMSGFPRRRVQLQPLEDSDPLWMDHISTEFAVDVGDKNLQTSLVLKKDPRVKWLAEFLQKTAPEKVLLICCSREKAQALDEALRLEINLKTAVFHEGLSLMERDRNAAWFSETDGARLLICSEIGSEGRNFQFAHHLVLFDLPLNPELLEQRIGRLDRIGQTRDIQIHVPFLKRSPQEVVARWYHEGLNAFEHSLRGGNELFKMFGRQVHDVSMEYPVAEPSEAESEIGRLLAETKKSRLTIEHQLEQGRDRLLELNSFRPATAESLVKAILAEDADAALEKFMLDVFDHFGVRVEELSDRTFFLNAQGIVTDTFPAMPDAGTSATFDRKRALSREEMTFLTWDHPMVTGAFDMVLNDERGNSSFGVVEDAADCSLLVETVFVLEPITKGRLHADRFLAATPLRVVVNHKQEEVSAEFPTGAVKFRKGEVFKLLEHPKLGKRLVPSMIESAQKLVETKAKVVSDAALQEMNRVMEGEIERLKALQKINPNIRQEEIDLAETQKSDLENAIRSAPIRLDSLRLIWKGPSSFLK